MSTNYLGPNVHGVASPAAAVPDALQDFAENLSARQAPLDPEAARVLHDNMDELYIEDSKVAAVPEGALPPLPKSHHKAGDFDSYADVYEPHEVQHIVRAAVEADRAQRQDMSMPPFAAPAGRHPIQPLGLDGVGTLRFKRNHIVDFLAKGRLNELACMDFPQEDREQLAQLIGYSLSGFGDLSYVTDETYEAAAAMWEQSEATRCRAEGGDGAVTDYGSLVDNSADRAQQGEPVAYIYVEDGETYFGHPDGYRPANAIPLVAATKAAAPADAPTVTVKMVNIKTGQSSDWNVPRAVVEEAGRAAPVPDTGIPTAGEVKKAEPHTYMTDEQAEKWAWEQVRRDVGTEGWTAGDSCNYYGFFLWGWRYRKQYESQRAAPSHPLEAKAGEDA